jgi:hypothetical protein
VKEWNFAKNMAADCESTDWALVIILTLLCILIAIREIQEKLEKITKVVVYTILVNYFLAFVYIDFLAEYVTESAGRWAMAIAIVIVLVAVGVFSYREMAFTFALVLMVARGLPLYVSLPFGFLTAVIVGYIVVCGRLADLAEMVVDSAVLAIDIAIGLVAIFANVRDSNAPVDCTSKHINMVLLCTDACQTVVTDDSTSNRAYWIILAGVLAALRIGYVYYYVVCNRPTARTEQDKRRCCPCLQKRTYKDVRLEAVEAAESSVMKKRQSKSDDNDAKELDPNDRYAITDDAPEDEKMDEEEEKPSKKSDDDDNDDSQTDTEQAHTAESKRKESKDSVELEVNA